MTTADIAMYVGQLFGVWAMGWATGLLFYTFKRATDFI